MSSVVGRNDPCPCGSGRKFKQCCLPRYAAEDSSRLKLRNAASAVIDTLLEFADEHWGSPFVDHGWDEFNLDEEVSNDPEEIELLDSMFTSFLVFEFEPDAAEDDAVTDTWPTKPLGLYWLETQGIDTPAFDRAFIETACRSPFSVFVIERVTPRRSVDLRDVLTDRTFRVLDSAVSDDLQPGELLFLRVLTMEGMSIALASSPWVIPPEWHEHVMEWRHAIGPTPMTRADLLDRSEEIRDLFFQIVDDMFDPLEDEGGATA